MINTQMSFRQTQPSPYIRRPAGRPTPTIKAGDKVGTKQAFSLDKYDWRSDVLVENYARSVPLNPSNRVTLVDTLQIKPGSFESKSLCHRVGREVELEGLIHDGRVKREKRTTTATSLGFDFILNPSITPLPDTDTDTDTSRGSAKPRHINPVNPVTVKIADTTLSSTPQTPGLVRESIELDGEDDRGEDQDQDEDEDEDEDEEWERVSALSTSQCLSPRITQLGEMEDEGEIIVLGELELEEPNDVEVTQSAGKRPSQIKLSYAAMLGKQT